MIAILFVCLSNICRSPILEAVLQKKIELFGLEKNLSVSSCGVSSWHIGCKSDERAVLSASKRGYTVCHVAQSFNRFFFEKFTYILAADKKVLKKLQRRAKTPEEISKIFLATYFCDDLHDKEIPDPYRKNMDSFFQVIDMSEQIAQGIILHLFP